MPEDIILSPGGSFQIKIDGITDDNEYFYSVEGLGISYQLQSYLPGGDINSSHMVSRIDTQPIIVKRPLSNVKSGFSKWCIKALESGIFTPVSMNIFILNNDDSINNHWVVEQAYPTGLRIGTMDVQSEQLVVMEIITIMYYNLKRVQ